MNKIIMLVIALVMVLPFVAGCSGNGGNGGNGTVPEVGTKVEVEGGAYWELTPAQLDGMLSDSSIFVFQYDIINLGNIPGTDAFIQYLKLNENMDKLPANKSTRIVIFCGIGEKSAEAARELVKAGYTRVHNLAGGSMAWRNAGYPVIAG